MSLFFQVEFAEVLAEALRNVNPPFLICRRVTYLGKQVPDWALPIVVSYLASFHVLGVLVCANVVSAIIITFFSSAVARRSAEGETRRALEHIRKSIDRCLGNQDITKALGYLIDKVTSPSLCLLKNEN